MDSKNHIKISPAPGEMILKKYEIIPFAHYLFTLCFAITYYEVFSWQPRKRNRTFGTIGTWMQDTCLGACMGELRRTVNHLYVKTWHGLIRSPTSHLSTHGPLSGNLSFLKSIVLKNLVLLNRASVKRLSFTSMLLWIMLVPFLSATQRCFLRTAFGKVREKWEA